MTETQQQLKENKIKYKKNFKLKKRKEKKS